MSRVMIYKLSYWYASFETDNAMIGNWKHAGKLNQGHTADSQKVESFPHFDILCFFFFLTMY